MKNKYRVARDNYAGFEAQVKYWYFPFYWFEVNFVNTRCTLDGSIAVIESHKKKGKIVYEE